MRGSRDSVGDVAVKTWTSGGKALQRLRLFTESRGLGLDAGGSPASVAQAYRAAADALRRTQAAPPGSPAPSWRSLGPTEVPKGQTYGASRVTVSGRVAAIAIDPNDRTHILVCAAGGGVWESRDRGATWTARTDFMPTLTTGAIAFDSANPSIAYVGTGEGNWYKWWGQGVLKSTDGGASWVVVAGVPFVGQGFFDLVIDPADSRHLLSATTAGIHGSTDGGTTWRQLRANQCWSVSIHPTGGPAAEVLASCDDGLYGSTDGGQTWAAINLPGAPTSFDRLATAHARSNPTIAFAFGASGTNGFLYRRDASGQWQATSLPPDVQVKQASYDWFLAVSPDSENRIYLGAIDAHRGDYASGAWTWANVSTKTIGDSIHPDQHAIAFEPGNSDVIYVGNDGGLFRSPDAGAHWEQLNSGLAITEIEYIAQDYASTSWVMAGTQDNGTICYTGSSVWDHADDGDGGDCAVNHGNPNIVFHSFYMMGVERSGTKGIFGSFNRVGPPVAQEDSPLFYPPMGAANDTIVQANQTVFVSRDNGAHWTQVALLAGCIASALRLPSPDRIYVGCTNGQLFQIDWDGAAWKAASALTSPRAGAYLSDIWADPSNPKRIWIASSTVGGGRVFRSDDGGASWNDCSAGLPALPVNAVDVDPSDGNRVWVGADLGVYQTFDGGATWSAFSQALPNALIEDLDFHSGARLLRAGTRSRGVWEIPVDA